MHPLQSFANIEEALETLPGSFFAIEGDAEALPVLQELSQELGGKPLLIRASQKPLYHLAASIASNYLVSLIHLSLRFLKEVGLPEEEGLKALLPLIDGTIKNIRQFGPTQALTGPIARGDRDVVKGHIQAISDIERQGMLERMPRVIRELYLSLGL